MSNLWGKFIKENRVALKHMRPGTFDNATHISLQFKYIFVVTPKAGCSSVKSILQRMELNDPEFSREDPEDVHDRKFSPLLKPSQVGSFQDLLNREGMIKFCFVRNPYSRILSSYLDKIKGNKFHKQSVLMHLGRDYTDLSTEVTFDEFIHVICEQPVVNMDAHWRTQYYQTFQDSIDYSFIGRFEDFENQLSHILSLINPDYRKFWSVAKHHSTGASDQLKHYYSEHLKNMVYQHYEKDFTAFHYAPELPG